MALGYTMRSLYFPCEQFSTITADNVSARSLATLVAPLALSNDNRSTQASIKHVENPRRGSYTMVTPENSDVPDATAAAAQRVR